MRTSNLKRLTAWLCGLIMVLSVMIPLFASAAETLLKTDKTEYTEGEDMMVTAVGSGKDWVGIYKRGEVPGSGVDSIRWYYVAAEGNTSGTAKSIFDSEYVNRHDLADLPAGEYTVYLLANDGYQVLAKTDVTVKEDPSAHPIPAAPSAATYERTGTFPGSADGSLSITAGEETLPDSYRAYWADKNGPLADYTAFAPIPCTEKVTKADLAAHTLIPPAADRILVYAVRGRQTSERAVEIMLPEGCNDYDFGEPLYELQVLSDIHLNTSQNHLHNQHFAMALSDIGKLSPKSIGIFVNGDIADHGQVAEYRAFNQLIENAGDKLPKVYCAIGNHDLANGPYDQQLKNFLKYTEPGTDTVYYDLWLEGAHFIFLGSEAPGLNAELSTKQLNWFEEKLAENRDPDRPTYVFLHQGLMDTVAGTFAYQKWHGINQSKRFAQILKNYPEVILFSGHSHWEMDSFQTMKGRDGKLPTIFNTAAGAYLWNDASMATDQGIEGSQGYYIYVYADKVVVRGRDFVNGQWIASAQFLADYTPSQTPGGDDPTDPPAQTEVPEGSGSQNPPSGDSTQTPSTGAPSGNNPDKGAPVALTVGIAVGAAVLAAAGAATAVIIKKRKSKK